METVKTPVSPGLLGMLGSVPDPRDPRGKRHALAFVLVVCVVATLAGAKNYREIAGNAAGMPRPLLKKPGAKWDWFNFRYSYPSMQTIRNVLTGIDAAGLDRITCAWLFAQARKDAEGELEIAPGGKVMRGAWTDENDKVTLFSAMLHREAVTIAQVRVPDGTSEITQTGALLNAADIPEGEPVLVTLDAALTLASSIPVYFAHAHSPWERGTNENTNGLLREYFPKGTDITGDIRYLQAVADEINDRPRAILGFRTPAEVFAELLLADNPGDNLSSVASTG